MKATPPMQRKVGKPASEVLAGGGRGKKVTILCLGKEDTSAEESPSEGSADERVALTEEAMFAQFSKWQAGTGGMESERTDSGVAGLEKRKKKEESGAEEDSDFEPRKVQGSARKGRQCRQNARGRRNCCHGVARTPGGGKGSEATPKSAKSARSENQTAGELWQEVDTTASMVADWQEGERDLVGRRAKEGGGKEGGDRSGKEGGRGVW